MQRRAFFQLTAGSALVGFLPAIEGCSTSRAGEPIESVVLPIGDGRIAFDGAGRRYAIDPFAGTVSVVDSTGATSALPLGDGLNVPVAIASSADGPRYVITTGGCEVHRIGADGTIEATFGGPGSEVGRLFRPSAIAVDPNGLVYVCDTLNHRIQIFDPSGRAIGVFGTGGLGEGELNAPRDLCFGPDGDVYVANTGNGRIERFGAEGVHRGGFGVASGRFAPTGIGLRPQGDLVVSDAIEGRLYVFSLDGELLRSESTVDGGYLVQPTAIAIEPGTGRVLIAAEGVA